MYIVLLIIRDNCGEGSARIIENVYYRVHKNLPLIPILIYVNAVHILTPYLREIHFNSIRRFYKWFYSCSFGLK